MTLRIVELFAGIGAQAMALRRLGIEYEAVVCEIDRHAYASYCAIHGDTPNLGDIMQVEALPECDLVTYSFPCQDLSIAGAQRGMVEGSGTRSSLLWEVGRLLTTARERGILPEALLMENVGAILNKVNRPEFDRWCAFLVSLGYTNSHTVLNAKDFGVPQSRRRCFMVSALRGRSLRFPKGFPLTRCLRDVLEDDVPDEFFLSDEKIAKYERHRQRHEDLGNGHGWPPSVPDGVAHGLTAKPDRPSQNFIIVKGNLPGYEKAGSVYGPEGSAPSLNLCRPDHAPQIEVVGDLRASKFKTNNRVYSAEGLALTLLTCRGGGIVPRIECATAKGYMEAYEGDSLVMNRLVTARGTVHSGSTLRIRFPTPRECWRLMGFSDEAYDRAKAVPTTKTQLYKQAGNSIVVDVLVAIFDAMYVSKTWIGRPTLEAFA